MSEDDIESTDASLPPERADPPKKQRWGPGVIAAVAVVAAIGGAVVARSISPTSGNSGTTPAAAEIEGSVDKTAATPILARGDNRGFDDVHQGAESDIENVLVSTDWLADKIDLGLEDENIVLIDISEEQASSELTRYVDGHIPGAQQINWGTDIVRENVREFIDADEFGALARRLGIDQDSTIVLYGDNDNWFAAYGAWLFKLHGAQDVRLLDGGLLKWEQVDGRELVAEVAQPAEGDFAAEPQNFDLRAFQSDVLDAVQNESAALVDIRSPEEFRGEVGADQTLFPGEGASVWGHIPGAINVGWKSIVNEDGTFKSPDEIRTVYEDAGVDLDGPIVTYCRIGERASHTWYALSQILGLDVSVYDGSWSEWGNAVGLPVENDTGERGGTWS